MHTMHTKEVSDVGNYPLVAGFDEEVFIQSGYVLLQCLHLFLDHTQ